MLSFLEPWIPVERASGREDRIAPWDVVQVDSDPPARLADSLRRDWRVGVHHHLVGILQSAGLASTEREWRARLDRPPSVDEFRQAIAPLFPGLERAHQVVVDRSPDPIDRLLVGPMRGGPSAPSVAGLCSTCVRAALVTLQALAPSGGRGHRASMRSASATTTAPLDVDDAPLWRQLWRSVLPTDLGPAEGLAAMRWVSGDVVEQPDDPGPQRAYPLDAYWLTPRPVGLRGPVRGGECSYCGASGPLWTEVRLGLRGQGAFGWRHPLGPQMTASGGRITPAVPRVVDWTQAARVMGVDAGWVAAPVVAHRPAPRLWVAGHSFKQAAWRSWREEVWPWPSEDDCCRAAWVHRVASVIARAINIQRPWSNKRRFEVDRDEILALLAEGLSRVAVADLYAATQLLVARWYLRHWPPHFEAVDPRLWADRRRRLWREILGAARKAGVPLPDQADARRLWRQLYGGEEPAVLAGLAPAAASATW